MPAQSSAKTINAGNGEGKQCFGFVSQIRRKTIPAHRPDGVTDAELIAEYLETHKITVCPTGRAAGSIRGSGNYEF